MVIVSSVRKSVSSSSEAVKSIIPTVDQNISAKYSPQFSVNDQAIDIQTTSASSRVSNRLNVSVSRSPEIVSKKQDRVGVLGVVVPGEV